MTGYTLEFHTWGIIGDEDSYGDWIKLRSNFTPLHAAAIEDGKAMIAKRAKDMENGTHRYRLVDRNGVVVYWGGRDELEDELAALKAVAR